MTASLDRRRLLALGAALAAGATGCTQTRPGGRPGPATSGPAYVGPHDAVVAETEARRFRSSAKPVSYELTAAPHQVDIAGRTASTWAYTAVPGTRELRAGAGDILRVRLVNSLPEETTVHWHGIRIRNDMDGAAPVTQPMVQPGQDFVYSFKVSDPGTYWYHSHVGLQTDRGLYGPLVVEDPHDTSGVAVDQVVVIDDWLDGLGTTPTEVLRVLNPALGGGGHMAGMDMSQATPTPTHTPTASHAVSGAALALVPSQEMTSTALGGVAGDIAHPVHLINGRPPADRQTVRARAGQRVRLRIVNAAADTAYRFAVSGHRMTVTHTDGYPVAPFETDTLIIGMAERYDVIVTVRSGVWPVVARAEGKPGHAAALLRTTDAGATRAPGPDSMPAQLDGRILRYGDLTPLDAVRLRQRKPDRDYSLDLIGDMRRFVWGIAGKDAGSLVMSQGERVRITMTNRTRMWHPMHLHGHTFAVAGAHGIRKDTVQVLPGRTAAFEFDADNPGPWMLHCHNAYHLEAGMTANLNYLAG